jgi:hypothetical protein
MLSLAAVTLAAATSAGASPDNLVAVTESINKQLGVWVDVTGGSAAATTAATRFNDVPYVFGMSPMYDCTECPSQESLPLKVFGRGLLSGPAAMGCKLTVGGVEYHSASVSESSGNSYVCHVPGLPMSAVKSAKLNGVVLPTMFGQNVELYKTASHHNITYVAAGPSIIVESKGEDKTDTLTEVSAKVVFAPKDIKNRVVTFPISFQAGASPLDEVKVAIKAVDPTKKRIDLDSKISDIDLMKGETLVEDATASSVKLTLDKSMDGKDDVFYFEITATDDNWDAVSKTTVKVVIESVVELLDDQSNWEHSCTQFESNGELRGRGGGCYAITKKKYKRPLRITWQGRKVRGGDECVALQYSAKDNGRGGGRHSGYNIGFGWWTHYLGYGVNGAERGPRDGNINAFQTYKMDIKAGSRIEFFASTSDHNSLTRPFATKDHSGYTEGRISVGWSCRDWAIKSIIVEEY